MTSQLMRTALYVPSINRKAAAKAESLGADAVIFDLEDAVAPDQKHEARLALKELPAPSQALRIVRVNARGTEWHDADIEAAVALQPHAIQFPKVNSKDDVLSFERKIKSLNNSQRIAIWAMIETPVGVLNAAEICSTLGGAGVIVLGLNDLAKETGMLQVGGRQPMLPVLTMTVMAARAHSVGILDGVFNAISDEQGFEAECIQGRQFGFDGKTIVHPRQIAPANAIFGPSESEVADARAIVAAFALPENASKGVISMEGRMVELMHLDMALVVIAKADQIARRASEVKG